MGYRHFLSIRPHTTAQASWPIMRPCSHSHLPHLLLDFDGQRTAETTMFLVDCRGLSANEGDFVAFSARRELTAGEIFAVLRDKVTCRQAPAAILVTGRPLSSLGVWRYSSPLIRLLSRDHCDARDRDTLAFLSCHIMGAGLFWGGVIADFGNCFKRACPLDTHVLAQLLLPRTRSFCWRYDGSPEPPSLS